MGMISEDVTRSARFWGSNEDGVEDYIRDEVLRIIFCSCVTLDSGRGQWRSLKVSSEEELHMLPSL